MITYELATELKDAGFPVHKYEPAGDYDLCWVCSEEQGNCIPTLSELIQACGSPFMLVNPPDALLEWRAHGGRHEEEGLFMSPTGIGNTPSEAVARLWLALNKPTV